MKANHSYIALICDRSGSMADVLTDAQGAVNTLISEQKAVEGTATLRLVDFDAPNSYGPNQDRADWLRVVYHGDIKSAPEYKLLPRGNTALHDAVGMTIIAVGEELAAMDEADRPEKVMFVVQTDGQENSSRDWRVDKLKELIETQTNQWGWQFVFLGMGIGVADQAMSMGIKNVTRSAGTPKAYGSAYANTSSAMRSFRLGADESLAGANVTVDAFGKITDDEGAETETSDQSA